MAARKATKSEEAIAQDSTTPELFSLSTGEILRAKALCPLVIVRTYGAGVHVGYLARTDGQEVELLEARRLWSWQGANTLNEVALNGVAKSSKVAQPLPQARLHSVIETLPVSEKAAPSLLESRW
ncbi:MAG: hypothetical protein Q8K32_09260 [Archangium sp.]|nr:hypothetical protein [Archangium sp.]